MKTIRVKLFIIILSCIFSLYATDVNISGTVYNNFGTPIPGATVSLKNHSYITATSGSDGKYQLLGQLEILVSGGIINNSYRLGLRGNQLSLFLAGNYRVTLALHDVRGRKIRTLLNGMLPAGVHNTTIANPQHASNLYFISLDINGQRHVFKWIRLRNGRLFPSHGSIAGSPGSHTTAFVNDTLENPAAVDTVIAAKQDYDNGAKSIDAYTGTCDIIMVRSTLPFSATDIPLSFSTTINASHTRVSNYGIKPQIAVHANSDNTFDVALHMSQTEQARILSFDSSGAKTGEFSPSTITGARALLGFTKIPDDNSFVLGWSKDNAFGQQAFEYWITRFDNTGGQIFSERIFGDIHEDTLWAKGEPGAASSGRIKYNATTKNIGFYCGHTMLWDDNVRHQGGYVGFMDLNGRDTACNTWFFSHNFDTRMVIVDSLYYMLAHGDAYPRALGFSKWNDLPPTGKKLVDVRYFAIPGDVGDNTTDTQTGGLIPLGDGTFGVIFMSKIGRENYDVCYMRIGDGGELLDTAWLTEYSTSTFAIFPRIAPYGNCILVLWEAVTGNTPEIRAQVIDDTGTPVSTIKQIDNALLSPFYDLVVLPNGTVVWAYLKSSDTLTVCRILAY
ncbi:carboxypeptidase-like regulatory domain-containing protein [Fibrobacterota bacterium]